MLINSKSRIISALVMVALLALSFYLGKEISLGVVILLALIVHDELFINFFRLQRLSLKYLFSSSLICVSLIYLNFIDTTSGFRGLFLNLSLLLNFFLLIYLFIGSLSEPFKKLIKKYQFFSLGIYLFLPFYAFASLFHLDQWLLKVLLLISITISMDSAAWFFGSKYGKHKLWPSVSPNKTFEGLVGGVLCSGLTTVILSNMFFGLNSQLSGFSLFIIFSLLALISQLGDLIQSKFKREFKIKDSSSLIPGHGGVYDRVDSLMFASPFYAAIVHFLG